MLPHFQWRTIRSQWYVWVLYLYPFHFEVTYLNPNVDTLEWVWISPIVRSVFLTILYYSLSISILMELFSWKRFIIYYSEIIYQVFWYQYRIQIHHLHQSSRYRWIHLHHCHLDLYIWIVQQVHICLGYRL